MSDQHDQPEPQKKTPWLKSKAGLFTLAILLTLAVSAWVVRPWKNEPTAPPTEMLQEEMRRMEDQAEGDEQKANDQIVGEMGGGEDREGVPPYIPNDPPMMPTDLSDMSDWKRAAANRVAIEVRKTHEGDKTQIIFPGGSESVIIDGEHFIVDGKLVTTTEEARPEFETFGKKIRASLRRTDDGFEVEYLDYGDPYTTDPPPE